MTVAQFKPLSDEGSVNHTPKTSHPRASGIARMTATPFDLEVYADRYSEMLEIRELEYQQSLLDPTAAPSGPGSLEDAAEEIAFNEWADREAERLELEEEDDRHRDQPAPAANIVKLDWPIVRGGGDAA
jgi:hypothetical protein